MELLRRCSPLVFVWTVVLTACAGAPGTGLTSPSPSTSLTVPVATPPAAAIATTVSSGTPSPSVTAAIAVSTPTPAPPARAAAPPIGPTTTDQAPTPAPPAGPPAPARSPSPVVTPAGATLSKLRVSGNRVVTEDGRTIRLRGVNFADPFFLENDDFYLDGDGKPVNHFAVIATDFARVKALGANTVRLMLYPGYYRLVGDDRYLSKYVDRMVDLAETNGLYAIISYQVIGRPGGWYDAASDMMLRSYPTKVFYTDSDMAVAFWNNVATRYGRRNHVLFEIYNEPADETGPFAWADWRPTGQLLIDTVRLRSDNVVLGPSIKYSSDLSDVPKSPYLDPNLVYVAHIYPHVVPEGEDQVAGWERLFGFLSKTYPVIVSEWGFHDGSRDPVVNGTLAGFGKPLLDYLDKKGIHWTAHLYHPFDAEPPMLERDWATLTEFGQFVRSRLQ